MATKKFVFLKHTADIKFQAFGKTLEQAFSNSALAVMKVIVGGKRKMKKKIKIKVKGHDNESLLYNFLEEILFLFESEEFLLAKVKKINIKKKDFKLEAELLGDNAENYEIKTHVKAVTYNEMSIRRGKSAWICQVVLDV